jgi:L-alanine-DL-glutamate epimerase-like enolase superfamily enzyme
MEKPAEKPAPKIAMALSTADYPITGGFAIARGAYTHARAIHVGLGCDGAIGNAAAISLTRYNETPASVMEQLSRIAPILHSTLTTDEVQALLPAGAARNALDCALYDLRAKQAGKRVWQMLGMDEPQPLTVTLTTISIAAAGVMADKARGLAGLLKVKLGGNSSNQLAEDIERLAAVATAAPNAQLIIDPNEGWTVEILRAMLPEIGKYNVIALEQPLPATIDSALVDVRAPCPVYADESIHTRDQLAAVAQRYQGINIKLGKTGGLTEALALKQSARNMGLKIMVGCMVEPSLATAPAFLVAQGADIAELDGPRLLATDCEPALTYNGTLLLPYGPDVWG